jgi:eukaryotic-like serine/threonine-protein kinase
MSTKIAHFEILSELSKSATGAVYKANDENTGQIVALKTIQLSAFGEAAPELQQWLQTESDQIKVLSDPNLAPANQVQEIDGQFCGAMDYIQGNSVATMLARKEGFSIWDLLDIGRQVCSGLDHAHAHDVVHYSLEPGKIMCGWDGTVRILGYGLTSVGRLAARMPEIPLILHYMSPEQISGDAMDLRSNLFSLGAIFYEMVTDSKAFNGVDADGVRQSILEGALPAPILVNPKMNAGLSDLIMKTLAKDPAHRYQNGRELLDDLEKCKESRPQAAKAAPAKGTVVPDAVKAANQAKFIGASAPSATKAPAAAALAAAKSSAGVGTPLSASAQAQATQVKPATPPVTPLKTTAAAASASAKPAAPKAIASSPFAGAPVTPRAPAQPSASMSSPVVDEPQVETPKINVDPMMAEGRPQRGGGASFSEMTELPPLKEVSVAPQAPPPLEETILETPMIPGYLPEPEKPKVSREVAKKAVKEIKGVPPQLLMYSIAGAVVIILVIVAGLMWHIYSLNNEGDSGRPAAAVAARPAPAQSAAQSQPAPEQPAAEAPEETETATAPEVVESEPAEPARSRAAAPIRGKNGRRRGAAIAAVVVPGQMVVDSTPEGAQIQIDGKTDASWVTPVTLSGVAPGKHSVTVTKSGYAPDSRTVEMTAGGKSFVQTRLSQLAATLAVSSTPAGANIYIDGKNTGRVTPAQVPVEKGRHAVLVRKSGFIEETTTAQFVLGQTVSFSPALRQLGNVDDIKTVGKMKKLFGNKEAQGMGMVSIRTQPKGAQIAVNQRMLDKDSPVEFMLDPGNYLVDITMSGYAPVHKVITVDRGDKSVIDEVLQKQ